MREVAHIFIHTRLTGKNQFVKLNKHYHLRHRLVAFILWISYQGVIHRPVGLSLLFNYFTCHREVIYSVFFFFSLHLPRNPLQDGKIQLTG